MTHIESVAPGDTKDARGLCGVVVENQTQSGTAPATVRDILATLVESDHVERIDGEHEPRYRLASSSVK